MFGYLQKIGRSLMIPVAVLPAAAILMGVGYWIDPTGWGSHSVLAALLIKSGGAIIDQMPILFAIGVAFGMSKDKSGNAALTGLVGFLVVTTLLSPNVVEMLKGITTESFNLLNYLKNNDPATLPAGFSIAKEAVPYFYIEKLPELLVGDGFSINNFADVLREIKGEIFVNVTHVDMSQLPVFLDENSGKYVYNFVDILKGVDLSGVPEQINLGAISAETNLTNIPYKTGGISPAFGKINNQFIGIIVGVIGAELYNRFSKVQLPKALSFFSGKRLVPIIMSVVMILVSFILLFVWPFIYGGLVQFGLAVQKLGPAGAGIFGFANRLLIPLGMHHALNSVFWFDVAGINDIPNFLGGTGVQGVTGMYQSGFFPIMMFGLIGAAVAFVRTAKPENKDKVKSIMIAAAFASFFTGVTEPLEFAFMFLAPPLYLLHAVFSGLSLYIASKMQWMAGFGFSAGLVDFLLSTKNPLAVKWYMLILQGIFFFFLYYFSFTFFIKKFKLKTPGREDSDVEAVSIIDGPARKMAELLLPLLGGKENIVSIDNCVTRLRLNVKDSSIINQEEIKKEVPGILVFDDSLAHVVIGLQAEKVTDAFKQIVDGVAVASAKPGSHAELAAAILPLLGGKENITVVDNCITRLRLEVKDSAIVQVAELKKITAGVLVPGKNAVQVIIGPDVEFVAEEFKKLV
ncbi:MAG: PTS transporter subunit EIIC [Spirochaetales bacterium]|nr:PTS transporter subunit EIIC [Spirochaetales bacterium]